MFSKILSLIFIFSTISKAGILPDISDYMAKFERHSSIPIYGYSQCSLDSGIDSPKEVISYYNAGSQVQTIVPFEEIPFKLYIALMAAEDWAFLKHRGIDPKGILRSLLKNLISGEKKQGGSTITQQVVKNYLLDKKKSYFRKAKEAILAIQLEEKYSKEAIISAYLNEAYFGTISGKDIKGIHQASLTYFKKPPTEVTWPEALLLISMLPGPGIYSLQNPGLIKTKTRAKLVLDRLAKEAIVSSAEAAKIGEEVDHFPETRGEIPRADFILDSVNYETSEIENKNNVTAVDTTVCKNIQRAIEDTVANLQKNKINSQVMVLVTDASKGLVLGLTGSQSYSKDQYNRVYLMKRPIGSLIKPFIYWLAFDKNSDLKPDTELLDEPIKIDIPGSSPWSPQNYDKKFEGKVPLQAALYRSRNVPTVNLVVQNNLLPEMENLIHQVDPDQKAVLSWVLGTLELSPLQLAKLFSLFFTDGILNPILIKEIKFQEGKSIGNEPTKTPFSMNFSNGSKVRELLLQTVNNSQGTANATFQDFTLPWKDKVSAKTGTTSKGRDSWFAAMVNNYLFLCWEGVENASSYLTGSTGAAKICKEVMKKAFPVPTSP